MNFIVKVVPVPQNVLGRAPYSICGIRGRISDIPVTLNNTKLEGLFYFEFLDDNENVVDSRNAHRTELVNTFKKGILAKGTTTDEQVAEESANTAVDNIYKAILGGTKGQRYAAMTQFAKGYSMDLLPIEEQTGKIKEEVVEEIPETTPPTSSSVSRRDY